MPAPDTADDLALLEATVREAGKIARGFFGGEFKRWDKSKGNPVTEADLAVDKFLHEALCAARPDYGWLSEETEDNTDRLSSDAVFVVDPIDGTIAFMKGKPHFTISVAVVRNGRPVAGTVFNPILDEMYAARAGHGAALNGAPIHVSAHMMVEGCRMVADAPMFRHPAWNNPPNRPWPEDMHIENRNSIAYRLALVADGQWDAMMALSSKREWDIAAGDLILTEAGGVVTTHEGTPLRYNCRETLLPSILGANPALHARLLERVGHIKLPRAQS
ncbi:MAG TPA: 3'(2'),5'-bisphosphate nucleotidase CysQ [Rhizomicrobium sp.]|nr:3'(2'),5'-bisphosphate nucleotidase CysQ [Rhizomicrobium sp.]